jgi:hypothetical protein
MSSTSIIIACILLTVAVSLSTSAPIAKRQTATTQTITYEQFLALQIGWTREQITAYLDNNPGEVLSETGIGETYAETVEYTNTYPFGVVLLILLNNQLNTKSQSGINQNQYPISLAQYNQITIGMTSAQVTSLVGSEGQVLGQSIDSIEIVGYNGSPNSYAVVQIIFLQGKVMSKVEVGL